MFYRIYSFNEYLEDKKWIKQRERLINTRLFNKIIE